MIAALRLLPLLIRRAPRQAAGAAALCAAGVAAAVLVASTIIAAYVGLDLRQARVVWREPTAASADSDVTGLQRRSTDMFAEGQIDVVELAPTAAGDAAHNAIPVPPGLRSVPEPGTAMVSPALADLIAASPQDQLGDRFGRVVGFIGDAGLARPDELVAVVGRSTEEIGAIDDQMVGVGRTERGLGTPSAVTPISGYDLTRVDIDIATYRSMALLAVVLVSVPALMLVGSAARLTAARRELRLAAIRLAGATPGAVRALAAAETAMGAVVGSIAGVGASLLISPGWSGVQLAGGDWFSADLRLGFVPAAGLMVGASLVSVLAAALSLRRVTAAPLGVARSAEPQRARWIRILALAGAGAALAGASSLSGQGQGATSTIIALGVVIGSLGLVGPWVCSLVGQVLTRLARRPSTLIAGRRILEDPKAAYRVVASVVLAGLVAGFLAGALPTAESKDDRYGGSDTLIASTPAARAEQLNSADLATRFPGTTVDIGDSWTGAHGGKFTDVVITPGSGISIEALRTATADARDGNPLISSRDDLLSQRVLLGDVRRGSLVILLAGLLLAAASSAVAAAASVVDQRRTIARLALTGVPVALMARARSWQTTLPLVAATVGAIGVGLGSSVLLMLAFGQSSQGIVPPDVVQLVGIVAGALVIGLASAAVTRPLLVNAARSGVGASH